MYANETLILPGPPILVVVKDRHYTCYALSPMPSARDTHLMSLLYSMGGVSETVEDGNHYFNVQSRDGQIEATLSPA